MDAATNGQRGLATYECTKPRLMPRTTSRAGKKRETYGGGPLAETEEAHSLVEGLEEAFGKLGRWLTLGRRRTERSEVTASSVFAACMTDTDWSFRLRFATGLPDDADSDDDNEGQVGGAGTSSHLSSSSSQMLQQIDLAAREDNAQYKPNPWSIARVNAASRSRQPNAAVKSVSEEPAAKKLPQGAIVDALKRQAQKPKATTDPSAQDNRLQTPLQEPVFTSATDALNPVSALARSPASIAHITTSAVDPVPIPSQLRIPQEQHQEIPLPSFLPRKTFPASHSSQPSNRSSNLQFTPNIKRVQPFSSPVHPPPHPQHCIPSISRPHATPPQAPVHFQPRTLDTYTPTPSKAHIVTNNVFPLASACREDEGIVHSTHSTRHPAPAKPERRTISQHPRQDTQLTLRSPFNRPIIKPSPKSGMIPPSTSFDQTRHFFEYVPPPVTVTKQPSPESETPPEEELHSFLPSSRSVIASPPRKYIDPYDLLPPSPDSEWSTLNRPTRKGAAPNGKGRSKASDAKSGKFRLPLSMGSLTPKEPLQKKPRVITYLPPPPSKKQKTVAEPPVATRDVETGIDMGSVLFFFLGLTRNFSLSSVSEPKDSGERVTLSTTLGRNGSTELTHVVRPIRLERCVHPLQTRPREDPTGTYNQ